MHWSVRSIRGMRCASSTYSLCESAAAYCNTTQVPPPPELAVSAMQEYVRSASCVGAAELIDRLSKRTLSRSDG